MQQLLRFAIVGVLNTACTYGIVMALHHLLAMPLRESGWVGYAAGVLLSFFLNRSWTFRNQSAAYSAKVQMALFFLVGTFCAYVYGETAAALARHFPAYLAAILAVGVVFCINFVLSRWLVFRAAR